MRLSHIIWCGIIGLTVALGELDFTAVAAVYSQQQALPTQTVDAFLVNPAALLTQYPDGGPQMIARVRDLAASNPSTLDAIVGLLSTTNAAQSTAIGTGLGQVALMAVKTDQAYANQIQVTLASAVAKSLGSQPPAGRSAAEVGKPSAPVNFSSQVKIGNVIQTRDAAEGLTENGTQPLATGIEVYKGETVRTNLSGKAELLFTDRTNLTLGAATEITLEKYSYDPADDGGSVFFNAKAGGFRFITGTQPSKVYEIKTPFGSIRVHGTQFIVLITPSGAQIQVASGEIVITTSAGTVITVTAGYQVSINGQGNVQGPMVSNQLLVNFADLGPPTTELTVADALAAFNAATGNSAIGAAGGGGGAGGGDGTGGGGGAVTAFGGGGGGGGGGTESFSTYVVNTPASAFTLSLSGSTPGTTTTTIVQSVSPH